MDRLLGTELELAQADAEVVVEEVERPEESAASLLGYGGELGALVVEPEGDGCSGC